MSNNHNSLNESKRSILISILLVSLVFVIKLFGGIFANSLALLSDSLHLITDIIALIISWIGLRLTNKPANDKYTFGHYRHSILTALINNIFLIMISIFIIYKAIQRFINPVEVESYLMIIFSALGIIINTIILLNLRKNRDNLNVKSAFLHFIGDFIGDASVLIGAIFIYFTGISTIDTYLSFILSILILRSAVKMTLECIKIFLESTPSDLDINALINELKTINNVIDVKDLHVWSLSKEVIAMTAIVSVNIKEINESNNLIHEIQHVLKEKFNISHTTIQLESSPCSSCFHSKPDHLGKCNMCIDECIKVDLL